MVINPRKNLTTIILLNVNLVKYLLNINVCIHRPVLSWSEKFLIAADGG